MIAAFANHLWQSTLCAGAAAILAWMLRRHAAAYRYRLWLAASLKSRNRGGRSCPHRRLSGS